ncbi:DUF3566 domain-containing protein [Patescibacteria group bacterium]|nr:DUF3566 domain-containing protein [Patescibacteria group bacterium]
MKNIKKIDILSAAKMFGLVTGGIYLVVVIIVVTLGNFLVDSSTLAKLDILGLGSTVIATILFAALIGSINFVIGAILAWFYNIIAALTGGIRLELEEVKSHYYLLEKRLNQTKAGSSALEIKESEPNASPEFLSSAGSQSPAEANQPVKDGVSHDKERDTFKAGENH